jgi:hypothetical protein
MAVAQAARYAAAVATKLARCSTLKIWLPGRSPAASPRPASHSLPSLARTDRCQPTVGIDKWSWLLALSIRKATKPDLSLLLLSFSLALYEHPNRALRKSANNIAALPFGLGMSHTHHHHQHILTTLLQIKCSICSFQFNL